MFLTSHLADIEIELGTVVCDAISISVWTLEMSISSARVSRQSTCPSSALGSMFAVANRFAVKMKLHVLERGLELA